MKETYFYEKRRKGRNIPARCARFCGSSQSRNETHNNMLKEIYMHEKRRMKETYLRVEQGLVTLSIGTANTSQKRHIRTKREFGYLMEETCMYEKRHIRTKRDICVRKESWVISKKRHICTKRDIYIREETHKKIYLCMMPGLVTHLSLDLRRTIICKKKPICMKRMHKRDILARRARSCRSFEMTSHT